MREDVKKQWHEHTKHWCESIIKHIDLNVPEPIIAHAVVCLFRTTFGYCRRDVFRELLRLLSEDSRRYVGLCADCDNSFPPKRGEPWPLCDNCHAKEVLQFFKDEMEIPYEEGEIS